MINYFFLEINFILIIQKIKIFINNIKRKDKTIINPIDNKRYSVFSKQGKQILQSYVKTLNNQSGGMQNNPLLLPLDGEVPQQNIENMLQQIEEV